MNEKFEQLFSELYGLEILTSPDMGKHIIKFYEKSVCKEAAAQSQYKYLRRAAGPATLAGELSTPASSWGRTYRGTPGSPHPPSSPPGSSSTTRAPSIDCPVFSCQYDLIESREYSK